MTAQDLARHLGVTDRVVRKWCANGRLPEAQLRRGAWWVPESILTLFALGYRPLPDARAQRALENRLCG